MARLYDHYRDVVRDQLKEQFSYTNPHQIPRLDKIVLNMGVGAAASDSKAINGAVEDMTKIAGQKPVVIAAKKSEATFKLREGMNIGVKVTLRRTRMYEFLDRLVTIAMPRIRDFRGLNPRSFDGRGNFAMGMKEQIVFPEINYDEVDTIRGLDIIICTTAPTDDQALALLKAFDLPFRETAQQAEAA